MVTIKLKQSRNWWIDKDLKWIIDNGSFIFTHKGHNGERPHIVTKEKLEGTNSNCFEIDTDCYGILIKGHSEYSDWYEIDDLHHSSILFWLIEYLKKSGAGEFLRTSPLSVFIENIFRKTKQKDKIISIRNL